MDRLLNVLKVTNLVYKRKQLLNDESKKDPPDYGEVDRLGSEIISLLKATESTLPFEVILESVSSLGLSPQLLNNDRGGWAVCCDGIYVVTDAGVAGQSMVDVWHPTVRQAVAHFICALEEN